MSPLPTPPSQDAVHSGDGVVFSTSLNGIQILALPQHLCLSCPVYGVRAELLPDLYGQFPFGSIPFPPCYQRTQKCLPELESMEKLKIFQGFASTGERLENEINSIFHVDQQQGQLLSQPLK